MFAWIWELYYMWESTWDWGNPFLHKGEWFLWKTLIDWFRELRKQDFLFVCPNLASQATSHIYQSLVWLPLTPLLVLPLSSTQPFSSIFGSFPRLKLHNSQCFYILLFFFPISAIEYLCVNECDFFVAWMEIDTCDAMFFFFNSICDKSYKCLF